MYNRYTPQPDGSFHRRRVQDPIPPKRTDPPRPMPEPECRESICPEEPICPEQPQKPPCPPPRPRPQRPCPRHQGRSEPAPPKDCDGSVSGFLRNLLPKDFDTGDLLVVLLLLLMAGDNSEDHTSALLTLALYLFL